MTTALGGAHDYAHFSRDSGIGLVWLKAWDGIEPLRPQQLDPFYVEICRRIRLSPMEGRLVARRGTSSTDRIVFPKGYQGITGDPWTPVDRVASKSLTIDVNGFHYRKISELIDPTKFTAAPLQVVVAEDGVEGLTLRFAATARGKSKTNGYHERSIPIPPNVRGAFGIDLARDKLAELANARVEDAAKMRKEAARPALLCLFQNAPKEINRKHVATNKKADLFLAILDREIDRDFFDDLFLELEAEIGGPKDKQREIWLRKLLRQCEAILDMAEAGSPLSLVRRYQSRAAARSRLNGAFYGAFKNYFPKSEDKADA